MKVEAVQSDIKNTAHAVCGWKAAAFKGEPFFEGVKEDRQHKFKKERKKAVGFAQILNVLAAVFTIYYFMFKKPGK